MSFIFGGNTGLTYSDLKRLRDRQQQQIGQGELSFGSGIRDIGNAIAVSRYESQMEDAKKNQDAKQVMYNKILANSFGGQSMEEQAKAVPNSQLDDTPPSKVDYQAEQPNFEQSQQMAQEKITAQPLPESPVAPTNGTYPTNAHDAFKEIMKTEGGYVAKDGKSGHPANFGINQGANPDINVADLTQDKAEKLFTDRYWNQIQADKLPENMRYVAADTAYNQGVGYASKALQQAGNDPEKLISIRQEKYNNLAKDPSHAPNLKGWTNRLNTISKMYDAKPNEQQSAEQMLFPSNLQQQSAEQMPAPMVSTQQQNPEDLNGILEMLSSEQASPQQRSIASELINRKIKSQYPDEFLNAKLQGQKLQNENYLIQRDINQQQYNSEAEQAKIDNQYKERDYDFKQKEFDRQSNLNDAQINKYNSQAEQAKNGVWSTPQAVVNKETNQPQLTQFNNRTGESRNLDNSVMPITKSYEAQQKQKTLAENLLPEIQQGFDNSMGLINQLRADPASKNVFGKLNSVLPTFTQNTADFEAKKDELRSGAFMVGIERMRGLGGLSEKEGLAVTESLINASNAQSAEAFYDSLNRYQSMMQAGLEKIKRQAGVNENQQPKNTNETNKQNGNWRF